MKNKTTNTKTAKTAQNGRLRAAVVFTAVSAAVLVCVAAAAAILLQSKYIYTAAAYLIPSSYTENESGVTFYKEEADAVPAESEEALLGAYSYYYIDDAGEKVYLTDGMYRCTSDTGAVINVGVSMGFVLVAVTKIKKIVSAVKIVIALLVFAVVAGIIRIVTAALKGKAQSTAK